MGPAGGRIGVMADDERRDARVKADAFASIASRLLIPVIRVVATSLLSRNIQQRQTAVAGRDVASRDRNVGARGRRRRTSVCHRSRGRRSGCIAGKLTLVPSGRP
jgi:hypothetical protein